MKQLLLYCIIFLTVGCRSSTIALDDVATPAAHTQSLPAPLTAPIAAPIAATESGQILYRIDPTQSVASYAVQELLFGTVDGRTVSGVTSQISGDLMIDWSEPQQSRLGVVTVDLSTLQSDSNLRDQRLRSAYLESDRFPLATFVPDHNLLNLPANPPSGQALRFQLPGLLTVHNITQQVEWTVTLAVTKTQVVGSAAVEIQMSDFQVGPINIVGLLETANTVQLQLDFVAVADATDRVAAVAAPVQVAPRQAANAITPVAPSAGRPEYFADIEPILADNCVACHQAGQIGHSVYPLATARDAVAFADDLAFVTGVRNMPPWPPSDNNPPFVHDRRLTAAEIQTIAEWAAAGAPISGTLDTPITATAQVGTPIRQDVVLRLPESFTPSTVQNDDYRCFVMDPQLDQERFVTGYTIVPDNLQVVHHVISFAYDRAVMAQIEEMEQEDELPGWYCFGDPGITGTANAEAIGALPSWTPGMLPLHFPAGTGLKVNQETILVIQMHYNTSAGTGPDQTALHLQLAPPHSKLRPITALDLAAPVEIPCPSGIATPACTRKVALTQPTADPIFEESLLRICQKQVANYTAQTAAHVVSDCDYTIGIDGAIILALAHMHTLGKTFRLELNPDTPQAQVLLDIDRWDFDWQGSYTFQTPIRVRVGDKVRVRCSWDNSSLPSDTAAWQPDQEAGKKLHHQQVSNFIEWLTLARTAHAHDEINPDPYRYIVWGEGTNDEMCLGSLAFLPDVGFEEISPDGTVIPLGTLVQILLLEWGIAPMMPVYATFALLAVALVVVWRRHRRPTS